MPMPAVRTIFLDFGNVIGFFDHNRAAAQLVPYTDLTAAELERAVWGADIFDDYECGAVTTADFIRASKEAGRLTCSDAFFIEAFADIFTRNEEVCAVVPKLKPRYRLVLASNTCVAHYDRYCREFADIIPYFDHLCPSFEAGSRKPAAAYFAYCQRFADADPADCLFVDDLAGHIAAAGVHGWRAVQYKTDSGFVGNLRAAGVVVGDD